MPDPTPIAELGRRAKAASRTLASASTGQKDDLDGNPLVLKLKPDGGLQGLFEGPDGMPFGLLRRDGEPPAPPTPPNPVTPQ